MMLLTNAPVPVPSVVLLSAVVGSAAVLQHTPRAVTLAPPSAVTLPPDAAVVVVISETAVVVTVGVAWLVTGQAKLAASIGLLDTLVKLVAFYLHERAWLRVKFGRQPKAEYEI